MPYIKQINRPHLETAVLELVDLIQKEGNGVVYDNYVTYCLYLIVKELYGEGDFNFISNGVKVLECTCDEFKRKVLHPYEDQAIIRNGDIV